LYGTVRWALPSTEGFGVRRLLIVLIVIVGLLIGLDIGSRLAAQYAVSRGLASTLGLEERPAVSLGGFPFLPRLLSGSVPTVTVHAGASEVDGVSIQRANVTLDDVRFSAGQVLGRGEGTIHARSGEGQAVVDGATVPATILGRDVQLHVRFEGTRTLVTAEGLPGSIAVAPEVDDQGDLVLRPEGGLLPLAVTVQLPQLIDGIHYTSLDVRGGAATLGFEIEDADVPCCG
jgi:hypothetical protein